MSSAHERAQEIDSIGAWNFPCDLARDLDVASSVDEKAGSAAGEGRAGERRRRVAQPAAVGGLDEQSRSLRDPVVGQSAVLEERLHQPIRERDLRGNLRVVVSMNRFQRPPQELVYVTSQKLPRCRSFAIRFLRYLLETGLAEVPPEIETGERHVTQFRAFLEERGNASSTISRFEPLCRHYIVWLALSDIPLAAANERIRNHFLTHDRTCVHPRFLDNRPCGFAGSDISGTMLRLFATFLEERDVLPAPKVPQLHAERREHLNALLHWLRQHRGLRDKSIEQFGKRIRTLLPDLGDDPGAVDAAQVRNTILNRLKAASRGQVAGEASAFRIYLRFLGSNSLCRPELVHAVPTIPRLRGESLPRHVGQNDIERMIATCDLKTPIGVRDRAVLLLARLA